MLFILKKKKEKKNVGNKKTQLMHPLCTKLERRREPQEDPRGAQCGENFYL